MLKYQRNNDNCPDLIEVAPAIKAGYAIINQDLQKFTDRALYRWMTKGLYPTQSYTYDISEQCYRDLRFLGIGLDTETEIMVRRVARIRLHYWYEEQTKSAQRDRDSLILGRGKDTRSKAIDTLLERAYDDWRTADEPTRKARRNEFHRHKDVGRKWCELVNYLGEGILVICGKEFDTKISNTLTAQNIHALATFVINCYPGIPEVGSNYESVVKHFIRNQRLGDDQWAEWYQTINWETVRDVLSRAQEPPQTPVTWKNLPDHSKDVDLSGFIRTYLDSRGE
ncbi:uncharacterized protein BDV14DRAFT_211149 [Aspergillus stella-maris]|uniref:uncharacterized protein n=1 Tax=Aspergillus stella-maris TaxID=1810926 RepID=UPI003CCCA5D6